MFYVNPRNSSGNNHDQLVAKLVSNFCFSKSRLTKFFIPICQTPIFQEFRPIFQEYLPCISKILNNLELRIDKSKKVNFAVRHFQKKHEFNHRHLSLSIYALGHQILTHRPTFRGKFESELRSGFRARN